MIVKKHFPQSSPTRKAEKIRLVSGANGGSVTDLDEFALTAIKKKKISESKRTKKNNLKKTTTIQEQNVPLPSDMHNDNRTNATNSASTTNITPIGIHNVSLPSNTCMLSSNTSSIISRSQPTYVPIHSLSTMSSTQCQLCFNYIRPLEMTSNCNQCHGILCWNRSSMIDQGYQLCQSCRAYHTNQLQQTYFRYNQ